MSKKKFIIIILALGMFRISHSQSSYCPNLDFEQGSFNSWQGAIGNCCPVNTPSPGIVAGRHTIMTGTGTDPNSCNQITYVAPGSTFSARLGNSSVGAQAERLYYTMNVTPPSYLFIYKYAVILQDPNHGQSEQPRFGVRVLDANGQVTDPVCGQYDVVASGSIPGFQSCGSAVRYKNWTTVGLDLSAFNGQTITIEFSTGDCSQGGHFGYAYIDASCAPLSIVANYCVGSFSATLTAPTGFTYLWGSGETTQSITVANPVAGQTYNCLITSVTGCQVNLTTVLQTAQPTANFTYSGTCNDFAFQDSSVTPASSALTSWLWDFGDSTSSSLQNPTHLYAASGTYNVHLTVTNATGCIDTITKQVTVYPLPVARFNNNSTCENGVITFTDSSSAVGSQTILLWVWDFGDGSPNDSSQNPSHTYVLPGIYNATLTITLDNDCSVNVTHPVTVWPKPLVSFNFTNQCQGIAIPFSDNSVLPLPYTVTNQAWSFGDGNTATGATTSHNYSTAGTYNGKLVVTTNTGCIDSVTLAVKAFFNPLAGFTQSDVCLGDSMQFTNTSSVNSSTSIAGYLWNFGDGSPPTNSQSPTHYYSNAGTYNVTLVTTTIDGCTDVSNDSVKVFDTPTSVFTFNNTCLIDSAKFINTSLNPVMGTIDSWSWDFGDGSSLNTTEWSPAHLYVSPGNYFVTLITKSSSLGCPDTLKSTITVFPMPLADFSFMDVCLKQPMNIQDLSVVTNDAITNWSWDFGDGSALNSSQNQLHHYTSAGTFTVVLISTTVNGCKDTSSKNVVVHPLPDVQFSVANVCDGFIAQINDLSTIPATDNIQAWLWNFGDNSPGSNIQNPSHLYGIPGTYTIRHIVASGFGCFDSINHPIVVWPKPVVNYNFISQCENTAIPFIGSSAVPLPYSATNWAWNFGDDSTASGLTTSHNYADGGTYNGTLVVTTNTGCIDSVTLPVKVFFNPSAGFTQNNICLGDTMRFTNTSSVNASTSIASYLWLFGDGSPTSNAQNPAHYYSFSGTYDVTLVTTTIDGCSDATNISVNVFDAPTSGFTFNNVCLVDSAKFTNTSLSPAMGTLASWSWNFGDGSLLNTTLWSPSHQYTTPGNYLVTLITKSSTLGCPDTLTKTITVYPMPVANFSFTDVCLNQTMNFNDSSTITNGTIANWSWNFGAGDATDANQNSSYLYTNAGTYNVVLTSTTTNGCMNTITKNVVVHPLPAVKFSTTNVCDSIIVPFNDLSTIPITENILAWSWSFGDNSPVNNSQDTFHLYNIPGTYTVKHIVVSGFGCVDSLSKVITVNPKPVAQFEATDTIGCDPLCTSFQNLSTILTGNNEHLLWNFGDGNSANSTNPIHCYTNNSAFLPVSFNVTLTVTSDSGCVASFSKNNYVTVVPNPDANFTVQPTTETIINPIISINDTTAGADFWNWDFGDFTNSSLSNPLPHEYKDTGTYVITLIASTQYNCKDTAYQTIIIEPDFVFYIPSAFSPDEDGINDTFIGKGVFIKNFEMRIFDRWGNPLYKTFDINQPWSGNANDGALPAQQDVYIYKMKVTDFKDKEHFYRGVVTLVR